VGRTPVVPQPPSATRRATTTLVTGLSVGCVVLGAILLVPWLNSGSSSAARRTTPIEAQMVLVSSSTTTQAPTKAGWLGVSAADVADGVQVTECDPGSPAAEKLRAGDVILAFNGRAVTKLSELVGFLRDSKSGSLAQISIERQGARQTIAVVLAPKR
jgi:S1-C subfamily serine protease